MRLGYEFFHRPCLTVAEDLVGKILVHKTDAGTIYVYLCYGMHNLMNIITGDMDDPQGVLIRCCEGAEGPGRLTKKLGITREHNRRDIVSDPEVWIEDDGLKFEVGTGKRVGIGYASQEDQDRPWRFILKRQS